VCALHPETNSSSSSSSSSKSEVPSNSGSTKTREVCEKAVGQWKKGLTRKHSARVALTAALCDTDRLFISSGGGGGGVGGGAVDIDVASSSDGSDSDVLKRGISTLKDAVDIALEVVPGAKLTGAGSGGGGGGGGGVSRQAESTAVLFKVASSRLQALMHYGDDQVHVRM
jgi:hypothetical protein